MSDGSSVSSGCIPAGWQAILATHLKENGTSDHVVLFRPNSSQPSHVAFFREPKVDIWFGPRCNFLLESVSFPAIGICNVILQRSEFTRLQWLNPVTQLMLNWTSCRQRTPQLVQGYFPRPMSTLASRSDATQVKFLLDATATSDARCKPCLLPAVRVQNANKPDITFRAIGTFLCLSPDLAVARSDIQQSAVAMNSLAMG